MSIRNIINFKKSFSWVAVLALLAQMTIGVVPAFATTSPTKYPTSESAPGSGANWSNRDYIEADDSSYATADISHGGGTTKVLKAEGYGFSIPNGSIVNGIEVSIGRQSTGISSPFTRDDTVKLIKGDVVVGNNKAATGTDWPLNSIGVATYGGSSDLWGTTWTVADINDSEFGVALSAKNTNGSYDRTASVDFIRVIVYYTQSTSATLNVAASPVAGGVVGGGGSFNTTSSSQGYTATATANSGYHFVDWTGAGCPSGTFAMGSTGVVNCTANFALNSYTITFDSNGGSAVADITQDYGTAVTAPADPTREGYTFTGWSPSVPSTMPLDGASLTAQWSVNSYDITFDSAGGSAVATISQDYGTAVTAPADPTRTGYTFAGWSPAVPSTMPVDGAALTAQWTINQYTIGFDSNGGTAVADITQDYDSTVTAPADPTREGYTFTGWDSPVPSTMPAFNQTLTAQWTINSYDANFDVDGVITTVPTEFGATIVVPTDPTKDGYTFAGWLPVPSTMPAYNETYVAQWTINQYTITFDSNGGSTVADITQDYNSIVTAPADPTRTGYTFAGWLPVVPATMPLGGATLVAQWTPVPEVLGDTTKKDETTTTQTENNATDNTSSSTSDQKGEVKGDTTEAANTDNQAETTTDNSNSDGNIFGLAWYWWLLILSALGASWWWIIATMRKRDEDK